MLQCVGDTERCGVQSQLHGQRVSSLTLHVSPAEATVSTLVCDADLLLQM